ncbi:MAG: restriction endonuclease subunit S [Microcystis aeruginosa Ma_SC_T_19800800_S464]|uniref:Restriction endonuclease subunit S n=1 Tax=Microcystis aeruginosa Ma_SC_T_19800800_S464 TaxID=2486257 RepID=A0A552E7C0_MICAE|nr:MAG: restriction endonuclease subunit S [Microcystis aeruginosa Ma_SC_T_19800800_S464]
MKKAPWTTIKLEEVSGDVGIFVDGDWVESKDQDPKGNTRLTQLADIGVGEFLDRSSRFLTSEKAKELKCTFLKEGDILVARMPDPIGRACIFPGDKHPCVTVVDVCIIRPNPREICNRWLMWMINSPQFKRQLDQYISGTTRQRISRKNLQKLKIPLPPLEEQRRIAAILDKADGVRRKRKEAIRLTEELLKSTFLEMFGDPVTNPKGWEIKPLGEVVQFVGGGTPSRKISKYFEGQICWTTSKDMGVDILTNTEEHITAEAIENSSTKLVQPECLLVVVKSKILMHRLPVARTIVPTCFSQDIKAVIPFDSQMTRYLHRHLKIGQKILLQQARGVNTEGLTLDHLRSYPVMMPSSGEIEKFVNLDIQLENAHKTFYSSHEQSENLFNSLLQRAFRGEL